MERQDRSRKPLSKAEQFAIFERDGWLCCWCKKPVIFGPVMKLLEADVRSRGQSGSLAYYHAHWTRDGSPLLDELGAVLDHIEAFSKGGLDSEGNLITACNKCNGRKSAAAADKWASVQRNKPIKGKYGEPQHWDGLVSTFVVLAERHPSTLTAGERDWLRAIKSNGTLGGMRKPNPAD
jgi:5-methylcytosine-specific restriction endonuclease McrA